MKIWLIKLLKDEDGSTVVDMLLILAAVGGLGFIVSKKLLDVLRPVHQGAVQNIKGVTSSGH